MGVSKLSVMIKVADRRAAVVLYLVAKKLKQSEKIAASSVSHDYISNTLYMFKLVVYTFKAIHGSAPSYIH